MVETPATHLAPKKKTGKRAATAARSA